MSNQFQRLNDFDKPITLSGILPDAVESDTLSGILPDAVESESKVESKPVESKPNVEPKLIILPTGSSSGPKFTCLVVSRPVPPPKKKSDHPEPFNFVGSSCVWRISDL